MEEKTIEFTKRFKLKGNNSKIKKPKAEFTSIINEVGNSEDIPNNKSQIKELVDEDVAKALKNYCILEDERSSKAFLNLKNAKGDFLLNKDNPNFDLTRDISEENPKKIYSKLDVDDSSEAIQEFLDSGGDTKPSENLKSKALTEKESKKHRR